MTPRAFLLLPLFSILVGCGGNKLRLEGADAVSTSARTFVEKADAALDDAKARRAQANATMVASDPSCEPLARIQVYVPTEAEGPRAKNPPLCGPANCSATNRWISTCGRFRRRR